MMFFEGDILILYQEQRSSARTWLSLQYTYLLPVASVMLRLTSAGRHAGGKSSSSTTWEWISYLPHCREGMVLI